jgi:TPR repeat protein
MAPPLFWLTVWLVCAHCAVAQADQAYRATHLAPTQLQYETALRYEEGSSVAPDPAKAMQWYLRAAIRGHAAAQNNLGALYFVQGNHKKAIYWYRLSAKKGNANAQFNLGLLYELGRGLLKDIGMPSTTLPALTTTIYPPCPRPHENNIDRFRTGAGLQHKLGTGHCL